MLTAWGQEGRSKDVKRLVNHFTGRKGKTSGKKLRRIIEKDQQIFCEVLKAYASDVTFENAVAQTAEEHGISDGSVKLIYQHYRQFRDRTVQALYLTDEKFFVQLKLMAKRIA